MNDEHAMTRAGRAGRLLLVTPEREGEEWWRDPPRERERGRRHYYATPRSWTALRAHGNSKNMPKTSIRARWRWWYDTLHSPRYVLAPMVLQGELPYRMMVRQHGVQLCYSPMVPAHDYLAAPSEEWPRRRESSASLSRSHHEKGCADTRPTLFTSCQEDRPLLVQIGGSNISEMVAAAKLLQGSCDGIDVNFGCPQRCAERGGYGAFLMDRPEQAARLVEALVTALDVPVTVKIRIFREVEATVAFARMLQDAGASVVAVHGRRRSQRHHEGVADWEQIRAVKRALAVPVIANGNVFRRGDADKCMAYTGADAVMSATSLLTNPRLFSDAAGAGPSASNVSIRHRLSCALEYLEYCRAHQHAVLPRMVGDHLTALLGADLARCPLRVSRLCKDHEMMTTIAQCVHMSHIRTPRCCLGAPPHD